MDKSKLIKFLNLSESDNDSEALSAIRKAHIFLRENNICWIELLEPKIIKENKEDYAILYMNFLKEKAHSQELINTIHNLKIFIKYLLFGLIGLIILFGLAGLIIL